MKCDKKIEKCTWRYRLGVLLADSTKEEWITCFDETARSILNISATSMQLFQMKKPEKFKSIWKEAKFKTFIFRLNKKTEMFDGSEKTNITAISISKLAICYYNEFLVATIKKLRMTPTNHPQEEDSSPSEDHSNETGNSEQTIVEIQTNDEKLEHEDTNSSTTNERKRRSRRTGDCLKKKREIDFF